VADVQRLDVGLEELLLALVLLAHQLLDFGDVDASSAASAPTL